MDGTIEHLQWGMKEGGEMCFIQGRIVYADSMQSMQVRNIQSLVSSEASYTVPYTPMHAYTHV